MQGVVVLSSKQNGGSFHKYEGPNMDLNLKTKPYRSYSLNSKYPLRTL